MCQHLENLHYLIYQYFSDVQNHAEVKCLFKMEYRTIKFNVTVYEKLIATVSESTLYLSFKNLLSFSGIAKKSIHNYQQRLLTYFFFNQTSE